MDLARTHIDDDNRVARTVFGNWLRFSLSPMRVYSVAGPEEQVGIERSSQEGIPTAALRTGYDTCSRQPRTNHFLLVTCLLSYFWLSKGVAAASSIALGTVSHARILVCVVSSWSLDLLRGRTGATQRPRVDARSQGTLSVQDGAAAAVDSTARKPKPKQKNKGGEQALEARLRAVEAATYCVVLVPREAARA